MQKLMPCIWFDSEAEEAAKFYTSVFKNSKINHVEKYKADTPSNKPIGSVMTVTFTLDGIEFMGLNGGPYFKLNPSISFIVACETKKEVDELWKKLGNDGKVLMPLDKYPFSERYGWTEDKFGVSWQLILTKPEGKDRPKIVPSLLFVGEKYGKAEEAMKFYLSTFKNSKKGNLMHYGPNQEPNKEGTVMFSDFIIENFWIAAMDGGGQHDFTFNEGISFIINCKDKKEADYYWKLSHVKEAEQCGWLKDKFGVSWRITPIELEKLMGGKNGKKVMEALLEMKRIDIAKLKKIAQKG